MPAVLVVMDWNVSIGQRRPDMDNAEYDKRGQILRVVIDGSQRLEVPERHVGQNEKE
jgi:hypothetical protein